MRQGLRITIVVIGVLVLVGVAARLAAPTLVERYVNRSLADMGEYRGTISGVDLRLLAGGYVLRDLTIVKIDSAHETPFATMPTMDLTLQWPALFRGQAVGEVVMHDPVLNFVQGPSTEQQQLGTGVNWPQEIRDLFPFRLNVVEAQNGLVTFRAPGISTNDSLTIRDFQMRLRNLTNVHAARLAQSVRTGFPRARWGAFPGSSQQASRRGHRRQRGPSGSRRSCPIVAP